MPQVGLQNGTGWGAGARHAGTGSFRYSLFAVIKVLMPYAAFQARARQISPMAPLTPSVRTSVHTTPPLFTPLPTIAARLRRGDRGRGRGVDARCHLPHAGVQHTPRTMHRYDTRAWQSVIRAHSGRRTQAVNTAAVNGRSPRASLRATPLRTPRRRHACHMRKALACHVRKVQRRRHA